MCFRDFLRRLLVPPPISGGAIYEGESRPSAIRGSQLLPFPPVPNLASLACRKAVSRFLRST